MSADWQPFRRPLAVVISITSTSIDLSFPPGRYLVNEPVVLCTVYGAPTEVGVSAAPQTVAGLGEVYTQVTLTFPAALVGKRAAVWVAGE
ncbi:MAG: hypothetical protein N2688_01745 [Burkholderiaceae bacterium]|jgi:hypothetical protein|nr:hypothetical protein [Burkholderiaceae bacterium]